MEKEVRKLSEEELHEIVGGTEPEEFDYKPKEYQTPVKEEPESGWKFGPIGANLKEEP